MKSNQKDKLLNSKDYLLLTICIIIFFIVGFYFQSGGNLPKDINSIYVWIAGISISTLIVLFILKKLSNEPN